MTRDVVQYQNANQNFESVVENFIVRTNEFERVMDDIRSTDNSSSFQHYVFVGRRGSGKSTLLRRIQAEVTLDENLNEQYEVINLGEEQSFIYKLYDLWDYVIRELNTAGYKIESLDFRSYKDDMKSYTRDLHELIINSLRSRNKRLILLLDNIDRILDSRSDNKDEAMLRELLINFHEIRIIGGSTVMSEHFWKYDKPFYQFFTIRRLEALSVNEVELLMTHWSKIKQIPEIQNIISRHPGKIQSIRMLTDGMPRTMLLFVDMMLNRPEQNGYQYLQQIVDKATPIYQERLGLLSNAQRKVLSELAFIWDAANVEELVPKCNMEGKVISALLNQLVDIKYVEKIKTKNKNNLYRVEERFFNLWFNMTQGGLNNRARAKALTDFLEKWYEQSELNILCHELSSLIGTGNGTKDYIEAMSQALLGSEKIETKNKQVLRSKLTNSDLIKNQNEIKQEDNTEELNLRNEEIATEKYQKALEVIKKPKIDEGLKMFGLGLVHEELNDMSLAKKYYLLAIEKGNVDAINNLANLYSNQGKEIDAEKYYRLAIKKGNADALTNLAVLYTRKGNEKNAEKYLLRAIKNGSVGAQNNLAILYSKQGKHKEAEKYFLLAKENGDVESLFNLGIFYQDNGKVKDAENYYLKAIDKDHIKSLYNLAILYQDYGKVKDAEKYYLKAIDKDHVTSLYNLAILYMHQGNIKDAERYYLKAIDKGHIDSIYNLATLYSEQGRLKEAEEYYLLAIGKGHVEAINNLAIFYTKQRNEKYAKKYFLLAIENGSLEAINNLAIMYQNQGKEEEAEKYYRLAIEKGDINALLNFGMLLYFNNKKDEVTKLINEKAAPMINELSTANFEAAVLLFLYIGDMSRFKELTDKFLIGEKIISSITLSRLLVHKQYNWVYKYFTISDLVKENFNPLYYATLHLIGDKDQEVLKMPPELKENVENILEEIKNLQKFYGY